MSNLNPRSESVLKALIEAYLEQGEPIGSRTLADRVPEQVSSATIRNVLADLEDGAFVAQPHTSAGRIPTERAYRYYVDRLLQDPALPEDLGERLARALRDLPLDPETWVRQSSRALSEIMQGVCVALPLQLNTSRLVKLEFVPLTPGRLVAVWVGSQGEVEHRVLDDPWRLSPEGLTELGNFATAHFQGLTLPEMRGGLVALLRQSAEEGALLAGRLQLLASQWTAGGVGEDPAVVVSGLGLLGRMPDFQDLERFRTLVAAFEERERLVRLLNAFAGQASTEVRLLLGSENPYLPEVPLATAVRTVRLGSGAYVTFALMGPLRMDYRRLLGGFRWWTDQVSLRAAD